MNKKDIVSLSFDELKIELEGLGEKAFRAKQIYEWLHPETEDDGIIPEQNVAAFNKDVKTITAGYKKIGDSASSAYELTGDTETASGFKHFIDSLKESYQETFLCKTV